MLWYIPVVYVALACATVKPVPTVTPTASVPTPPSVAGRPTPTPLPVEPNLPIICKQLNEMGVQTYPSLNPG